ncbi:MAG: hypothetical protein Q4B70_17450, partial [Lachnospiraceae bacterium]|nr:hypothetical protein [Lachnospiraceae bacterium]
ILRRLGVRQADREKAMMQMLKISFGTPCLLAMIHSVIITAGIYLQMNLPWEKAFENIALSFGVVAVVYVIYYMVTCAGSRYVLGHGER